MFRFSIGKSTPISANADQLATAGITEDKDWEQRLRDRDEHQAGERYYRVENENPETLDEAVEYVQGVLMHPPRRVWIDDELHDVEPSDVDSTRKPRA